jgi:type II secretory pathway pseudopilin PulG
MIVIAIIGVLASLVLVSLTRAKTKARKSSAIASAKSVMGELSVCYEDYGDALGDGSSPTGGTTPICCADDTCAVALLGYDKIWPDVTSSSGWAYNAPTGNLFDSTYQYTLSNPDATDTITCDFSTKACN